MASSSPMHRRRSSPQVVFVTRSGCSLCGPAQRVVTSVADEVGVEIEVADLSVDDTYARYDIDIPAVLVNEELVARYRIDPVALRRAIVRSMGIIGRLRLLFA